LSKIEQNDLLPGAEGKGAVVNRNRQGWAKQRGAQVEEAIVGALADNFGTNVYNGAETRGLF
jgi:hypothetical protein